MENCLFNNPMVDAAKKALTPEQLEDYKRMGEYMYNSIDYKNAVMDPKVKETKEEDFVMYAVQALKAGGDPNDLTEPEIQGLNKVYGDKWYEMFGLEEHEVSNFHTIFADAQKKAKGLNLNRQQRRAMEKDRKKLTKSYNK